MLAECHGPASRLDLPGVGLASAGLFGIVFGVIRGNGVGWAQRRGARPRSIAGVALVAAFVAYELPHRAADAADAAVPLPRLLRRQRGVSLFMFFGMFGSIFLLAQFLQTVQRYSPLASGLRTLPWTAMPVFVAPIAGRCPTASAAARCWSSAWSCRRSASAGWPASPRRCRYCSLVPPFILGGVGMGLFFAPVANVVLSSVRRDQEGIASGTNNAIRELGGVFGIAVLASIFTASGGYTSGQSFVDGLTPASGSARSSSPLGARRRAVHPRPHQGHAGRGRGAHLQAPDHALVSAAPEPGTSPVAVLQIWRYGARSACHGCAWPRRAPRPCGTRP